MFARVTTVQGSPDRIDETTGYARERVLPAMQAQPGFKGMYMLVDRKQGRALGITLWESEEALRATAETAGQMRAGAMERGATAERTGAEYEVTVEAERRGAGSGRPAHGKPMGPPLPFDPPRHPQAPLPGQPGPVSVGRARGGPGAA